MDPQDKGTAIVSGGSRGIGRATVLRLARDGFAVDFCYRSDDEAAADVEREAATFGGLVRATRVDVTDARAVGAWVTGIERERGAIEVAVTSAGIIRDKPLVMMPAKDWTDVLDTNLGGVYNVCRAVAISMIKRKAGSMVNLSSVSGVHGNAAQTNYSAAKAGIIGFSKALAKEIGRYGVRVNVVAPGFIETDMTAGLSESTKKRMLDSVALGRFGRSEEVAELIGFLASGRAAYVTGSVFEIHGGIAI